MDDVTSPLLMALERLSPLERAAFLLHDVFGLGFEEVAATIDREPEACRQLASRARGHVRADRPRYPVPRERGLEIAEAFFAASRHGDMERLRALLVADVTLYANWTPLAALRTAPPFLRPHPHLNPYLARCSPWFLRSYSDTLLLSQIILNTIKVGPIFIKKSCHTLPKGGVHS
jgi:hypothetical protein